MTEYGRGEGSEPWQPEDPLYGDGGWGGQQAQEGRQSPYGGQPQQQPQQPQYDNGGWGDGRQAAYGHAQQPNQQQYGQPQYDQPQYEQQHYNQQQYEQQQYEQQQYEQQQYGQPQYDQPQYEQQQYEQQQYEQQQYAAQPHQQYGNGGWAQGAHQHVEYTDPSDPSDPYGQQGMAHSGEQPGHYGTPDAYPPPEPPGRRRAEPEPRTDWDPGPDQGEHAFFAGGDDDEDDSDDPRGGRGDRKGRGGKKSKKRRSGCACLVLTVIFAGGVGGAGYFGYQFYQSRFGPSPDYAGDGNGKKITVAIPKGAGGYLIGQKLKDAGVVESVDAFVSAQQSNPDGKKIQDGVYELEKEMSAASAVELMLSPESRDNLIIAEGWRNSQIYAEIDKRLGVPDGTTAKAAKTDYKSLGLPDWALDHPHLKDPLEGFLYPSSYGVTKGQKPEAVLKDMVAQATETYDELGLEKKAKSLGLDGPWQLLTVASLVQAEGRSHEDFRKMAEVIYNRLKPGNSQTNGLLEFDSTYNYVKNQSRLDLSIAELRQYDNPYNTYYTKGLPPGPIDNPGAEAIKGALTPTHDGWYYFISLNGKTSKFTKTLAEHDKLVTQWNASRDQN